MKYLYAILGLIIFIIVTIYVYSSTDTHKIKKVYIINQSMSLISEGADITNEVANIDNSRLSVEQEKISLGNSNIISESSQSQMNRQSEITNEIYNFDIENNMYNNSDSNRRLKNIESTISQNKKYSQPDQEYPRPKPSSDHGFSYEDISWNTWKSNFINRILDDSMKIKSLNSYGIGTWFYYSFYVTDKGEILNIKVTSFALKKQDKDEIARMIANYAYKDITVFPRNSRRKKAKVDAIMMLGESENKSRPEDFNDTERVRIYH